MADKKISALTAATTPLAGSEVLPIVQGGTTVKASVDNVLGPLQSVKGLTAGYVLKGNNSSNVSASIIYDNGSAAAIGTTSPQGAFSIGSLQSGQIGYTLDWTGAGGPYAVATFTADRGTGEIRHYANSNYFPTFYANNIEYWRINTSGNLVASVAGKGIDFSANGGDVLSQYDEGTWVGALACGTSGTITLNASFQTGSYTRIGRLVTVTGLFLVDSVSSPVGVLYLTGLPFAISNGGNFARTAASVCAFDLAATAVTSVVGRGLPGESQIQLYKYSAGALSNLAGDVVSGSQFYVSMTYITA